MRFPFSFSIVFVDFFMQIMQEVENTDLGGGYLFT